VLRGPSSVFVEGELWSTRPAEGAELAAGDRVRVVGREGMTLIVEPLSKADETSDNATKES
jgi:membrane protein implicated in regulation of membrane protease activity